MEINLNTDTGGGGGGCGNNGKSSGEGFIDRSRVRILLCDNDPKCSEEVVTLLINCSYQVTSVRSARQVIDALNAEGPDIDIILAEVDLPMAKGMKMLKYITRDKDLRRIPVIMMSAQDEVSIVVKCLRLGAADYLVKPLRTNELLNLWTHMWRRRRLLGLAEKNVMIYDFDLVGSDPSDANTNSTTLFSDDTDDKSRRSANPEIGMSIHHEESNAASAAPAPAPATAVAAEPPITNLFGYRPGVPGISDRISDRRTGQCSLGPRKSEFKAGESSAFFTYVKTSTLKKNSQETAQFNETAVLHPVMGERVQMWEAQLGNNSETHETSVPDSLSMDRSSTPVSLECSEQRNSKEEESSQGLLHPRNEHQIDVSGFPSHSHSPYPYYMSGMVNQMMIPASAPLYQKNLHALQNHATSSMVSQYNQHHLQCPHVPGMASFPYYPINMYLQSGQISTSHPWPSYGTSSSAEVKVGKVDRREAALFKFRQKRKERCFDKKIRYVNRKKLAERRPRVRGQFVRKINGINVDLNGQPTSGEFDDDEEEDEDEHA